MTRSELIQRLSDKFPHLTINDTELSIKTILDGIAERLVSGGRAEIRDFGTFSLNIRPPRLGRNPKTGDRVQVPEQAVPHFQPGRGLRQRVNSD